MKVLLAAFVACAGRALATSLPHVSADDEVALQAIAAEGKWWAKVGDHVVHQPKDSTGLSSDVSSYYYAYGSEKAIPDQLMKTKVAGDGRAHIFHLPNGTSSMNIELPHKAGRRSAMSALLQLKHAKVLSNSKLFPVYKKDASYKSSLNAEAQKLEKSVVGSLSSDLVMKELEALTKLPGSNAAPTRCWSNDEATQAAVTYIQKKFTAMGYKTCLQSSTQESHSIVNVVAYLPGTEDSSQGTVTLGGHYDSRPFEGAAPGAVDNGSGSAAVLSIAKAVAEAAIKPKKPVFFVAFAAEEPGLWGSEDFATKLTSFQNSLSLLSDGVSSEQKLLQTVCGTPSTVSSQNFLQRNYHRKGSHTAKHEALIMDEIAWKSPNIEGKSVVNLESYDWSSDVLEALAQSSATHNGNGLLVTHSGNPFGSDHMSFLNKGFQSVLSIHGDDEAYPSYHTEEDTMDKVNPELYTKIVKMNAGALLRLAGINP